ncbi:MAG: ATP-binding protein [Fibrobacterota bacterium]
MSVSIFYLIPVAFVTWFVGPLAGALFSIMGALLWFYLEKIGGHVYAVSAYAYWNASMRGMIFLMTAFLLAGLKRAYQTEKQSRLTALKALNVKSVFLANMSHEIRTPMNSILAMADLLSETPLNMLQKKYVTIFKNEGIHLLNLINDILYLSKIEAGQYVMEKKAFDLVELLEGILSIMNVRASEKKLELSYHLVGGTPTRLLGPPEDLRRILLNLVSNAVKFTENGYVFIRVEKSRTLRDCFQFSVADTGKGIPADNIASIFHPYTQAEPASMQHTEGTGLGLNISRQLVNNMGGKIWVDSRPGQGSTFSFTVSLEPVEEKDRKPGVAAAPAPKTIKADGPPITDNRKLRILLVEDNSANREVIHYFLNKTAYIIEDAENGKIGFEKFKISSYDIVLMDIQMPVMDGYEAIRAVRNWEREQDIRPVPIVALTAHAFNEDAEKSLAAGCNTHLTKPLRKNLLLETIFDLTPVRP